MRTKGALCATLLTCTGVAAFAASGFGDDAAMTSRVVKVAMEPASGPAGAASRELSLNRGKRRAPLVTNLITERPVTVEPNEELVATLTCAKEEGIPLSGGAISPPAPAEVAISVLSRFHPNHPIRLTPRNYYVGVRNLGDEPEQFNATLVCAKGIDQR
jgi:hypothetical protein